MRKIFEIGGVVAAAVLIAFGIAAIVMGMDGRSTVNSSLKQEQIYGSGDMSPSAIQPEVTAAQAQQTVLFKKLNAAGVKFNGAAPVASPITAPSCSVANEYIDTGDKARCFAQFMRIHTFAATSGETYSQMGRYVAKADAPYKETDGLGGTSNPLLAKTDPKTQQPVSNGRRDLWVTYTALTTALNTSYMASQIALFGIVVGVALLLSGIGFAILAISGALRSPEPAFKFMKKWTQKTPAVPAA
jgi:hypothetical protein